MSKDMKGVWGQINKMKKTNKIYEKWTDHLICKIYKCNKEGEPITKGSDAYTAGNLPPLSRIDKLEKRMKAEKLKDKLEIHIKSLENRLEELEKEHKAHTHDVPGVQQNETRSEENRARIRDLEQWRQSLGDDFNQVMAPNGGPGAGGGKRRKKTRKKRRKKKTKKRRKKRRRKKRTKRRI